MILLTGATGYLGGYVLTELLRRTDAPIGVLVRGDHDAIVAKLWKGLQLHMGPDAFRAALDRLVLVPGDLHHPELIPDPSMRARVVADTSSIIHSAASLNRKSEKACLNTNLRGTLAVIELARDIDTHHGLDRFSLVSTVGVAGTRSHEVVHEDTTIDWDRNDYDPYARTKKFAEHMVRRLLSDIDLLVFRPGMMIGDGARPQTTQFDMVRAVVGLADMPVLPFRPTDRFDILNVSWCAEAIARLHLEPNPEHDTYNLSAGVDSPTAGSIRDALVAGGLRPYRLMPALSGTFDVAIRAMNRAPRRSTVGAIGGLMKVFWPYVVYDTVFDNTRAVAFMGRPPARLEDYVVPLIRWCKEHRFRYPFVDLPAKVA